MNRLGHTNDVCAPRKLSIQTCATHVYLVCEHLHQPGGWLSPGTIHVDDKGFIVEILEGRADDIGEGRSSGSSPARTEHLRGFVVPGFPNVHSHAFQRAMVGQTEHARRDQEDNFWTWRQKMFELAHQITPDQLEAIAALLYLEMLEAGITLVGEFHYLHHDLDGRPYEDRARLSRSIFRAARRTGIGLTHLPVLYMTAGFGKPATVAHRRFAHGSVEAFIELVEHIAACDEKPKEMVLGLAPHSLRAVPASDLEELLSTRARSDPSAPVHIHIAEQKAEVDACLQHLGQRPTAWLLEHAEVDERWCLVHATHTSDDELREIASRGAVIGLCPTTEANLGDGHFSAAAYVALEGRFGIGSDSHVTISPPEELRWLEYTERLRQQRRNVLLGPNEHTGRFLFDEAVTSGAQALGQKTGRLTQGHRADLVVLDKDHPALAGHDPSTVLDAFVFGFREGIVRDVMVLGEWKVRNGRHVERDALTEAYLAAVRGMSH